MKMVAPATGALIFTMCGLICGQTPQTVPNSGMAGGQPELISSMNLESLEKLVQGMGFECTRDRDESGKLKE